MEVMLPSKSPAQKRLMRAVAHSPEFAKKVGIPQSVGKEFNEEDKRRDSIRKALRKVRSKP